MKNNYTICFFLFVGSMTAIASEIHFINPTKELINVVIHNDQSINYDVFIEIDRSFKSIEMQDDNQEIFGKLLGAWSRELSRKLVVLPMDISSLTEFNKLRNNMRSHTGKALTEKLFEIYNRFPKVDKGATIADLMQEISELGNSFRSLPASSIEEDHLGKLFSSTGLCLSSVFNHLYHV